MSCEELVQFIEIQEFAINERLGRPTHFLGSSNSSTIYISRTVTSISMALNYLSEPIAAYFGVSDLVGNIRTVLNTPEEHVDELFKTILMVPELPDEWKDTSASYPSLSMELVSKINNPQTSSPVDPEDTTSISLQSDEMANEELASIMGLINNFTLNINSAPLGDFSPERRQQPKRKKKNRFRQGVIPVSHGYGEKLNIQIDSSMSRNEDSSHRIPASPWEPVIASDMALSLNSRPHFQDDDSHNYKVGFAGEYFVYYPDGLIANASDLSDIEAKTARFFVSKLD
jgi:hypothetical protein